jgi:hypothetical protein
MAFNVVDENTYTVRLSVYTSFGEMVFIMPKPMAKELSKQLYEKSTGLILADMDLP